MTKLVREHGYETAVDSQVDKRRSEARSYSTYGYPYTQTRPTSLVNQVGPWTQPALSLKETMEQIQEDVRVEMRKHQTFMTEIKNFEGEVKKFLEGITSKVTVAEDSISELEDEPHNNSIQQEKL